jgi:hypothetical protein
MIDRQRGVPISLGSRIPLTSLIQTLAVAEYLNFRHGANALGASLSSVSAGRPAGRLAEADRHFVELAAAGRSTGPCGEDGRIG